MTGTARRLLPRLWLVLCLLWAQHAALAHALEHWLDDHDQHEPDRDAHALQARPSMLRDAELVVAVGAELELGWLPAAIAGAADSRIQPGRPGYFEAAAQVPLLDAGQPADRARGNGHPMGNPQVNLDPARMADYFRVIDAWVTALAPPLT